MLAHQVAAPSWCDTLNAKNAEALLRNDAALEEARKISLAELAPQFFREALGVSGAGMIPRAEEAWARGQTWNGCLHCLDPLGFDVNGLLI